MIDKKSFYDGMNFFQKNAAGWGTFHAERYISEIQKAIEQTQDNLLNRTITNT